MASDNTAPSGLILRNRRASRIPAQMLQPIPIATFHPHRRVQREPIHIRAQRPLHERLVLRPATNPLAPFSGPFAERRIAMDGNGEPSLRKQRSIRSEDGAAWALARAPRGMTEGWQPC